MHRMKMMRLVLYEMQEILFLIRNIAEAQAIFGDDFSFNDINYDEINDDAEDEEDEEEDEEEEEEEEEPAEPEYDEDGNLIESVSNIGRPGNLELFNLL